MLNCNPLKKSKLLVYACFYSRFRTAGAVMITLWLAIGFTLSGQESVLTPSRETAMELFAAGNWEESLTHFDALSAKFPADPVYKYYRGACLVMMGKDPSQSAILLEEAIRQNNQLRPLPGDARFLLGRAYQQKGMYREALGQFDLYMETARKKEIRELEVERYIRDCNNGTGAVVLKVDDNIISSGNTPENIEEPIGKPELNQEVMAEKQPVVPEPAQQPGGEFDAIAREALLLQFRADSVNRLADRYRARLNELAGTERESIARKIIDLEQMGFEYQSAADRKFRIVSEVRGENRVVEKRTRFTDNVIVPDSTSKEMPEADSLIITARPNPGEVVTEGEQTRTDSIPVVAKEKAVLMLFSYDRAAEGDIEVNPETPAGLFYRIQTAAFRNPVKPGYFKTLSPVYGFRADNSDITFYFIGLFRSKSDADKALVRVRSMGFSDAFVVAVFEGKRISFERAASLEPGWKDISLVAGAGKFTLPEEIKREPSEPPTLVYRVEVKKVARPVSKEDAEVIRRLAGDRKFDILTTRDNMMVYLIGKFITFESAVTYSDLLYRNGLKDAKVVAYLGDREIPIEKARELFDLYFNKQ